MNIVTPEAFDISGDKLCSNNLFVYINVFAAAMLPSQVLQKFISDKLHTRRWKGFPNDLSDFPATLIEKETDVESFFDGLSVSQYLQTIDSHGIYINAMYSGVVYNPERWANVIYNSGAENQVAIYVDVPYEIYKEGAKELEEEDSSIDKITYDDQSEKLKNAIGTMGSPNSKLIIH